MIRRWYMCSSKSSSIRPRSKNGPMTGSQARCENSLLRLEKTAWVASGPSAITEDRQPRVTHCRLEVTARGRLGQRELPPLVLAQSLLGEVHSRDRDRSRLQPPFGLVEQVILGADGRHLELLGITSCGGCRLTIHPDMVT